MSDNSDIEIEVENHLDKIQEIDDNFFGCSIGVAEAIDRTRMALNDIDQMIAKRRFQESSMLGYGDVTSNFIFLQRTLGALQTAYDNKTKLVSEIACQTKRAYEEVEPYVDAKLSSMIPRKENTYTPEELEERAKSMLNKFKSLSSTDD